MATDKGWRIPQRHACGLDFFPGIDLQSLEVEEGIWSTRSLGKPKAFSHTSLFLSGGSKASPFPSRLGEFLFHSSQA